MEFGDEFNAGYHKGIYQNYSHNLKLYFYLPRHASELNEVEDGIDRPLKADIGLNCAINSLYFFYKLIMIFINYFIYIFSFKYYSLYHFGPYKAFTEIFTNCIPF